MVTIHKPSCPLVISCAPPNRTSPFYASGAETRKVTLRSAWTHGYGAPGIFSEEGLQSSGACPQNKTQLNNPSKTLLMHSPSEYISAEVSQALGLVPCLELNHCG